MKALDTLDELDRKIIVALQHDGRASWTAIADMVGSSTATVARRGQQLVADGIVRIAVVPALGSSGQVDSFLVRLNCRPGTQLDVTSPQRSSRTRTSASSPWSPASTTSSPSWWCPGERRTTRR